MIYTVTFNPALDYLMEVDSLKIGQVQRSKKENLLPGGKGINVSIVLTNLEIPNIALGFKAGWVGEQIQKLLQKDKVQTEFYPLSEGNSRINVKIKGQEETAINADGPIISQEKLHILFDKMDQLQAGDFLILSGSIPISVPDDIYSRICQRVSGKNVNVVVDATGELLLQVLPFHPFLIKPNHMELGDIFGVSIHTVEEAIYYGKKLKQKGARQVLVSMGRRGAALIDEQDQAHYFPSVQGKKITSVGSGDSMVAGFVAGYLQSHDAKEALRLGIAAGAASTFSKELATKEEIMSRLSQVTPL